MIDQCQYLLCNKKEGLKNHMFIMEDFGIWIILCDRHKKMFEKKFKKSKNWASIPN